MFNQMEANLSVDLLDERIDVLMNQYELEWSPESRRRIAEILKDHRLEDLPRARLELLRVDIDFRYRNEIDVCLADYLELFPALRLDELSLFEICLEDYRSRQSCGLPDDLSRYETLIDLEQASWLKGSARERSVSIEMIPDDVNVQALTSKLEDEGFRIECEIGQGRFSRVYLARQTELSNRAVVLKVVRDSLKEPQNLAMLQHTNIVPIYSHHAIDQYRVVCMPYFGMTTMQKLISSDSQPSEARTGQGLIDTVRMQLDLESTFASGDLERPVALVPDTASESSSEFAPLEYVREMGCEELAIWVFQRLSNALLHSHARGIIHGDIKPANVLIRNDGEPALMDFNLSQVRGIQAEYLGGTLPYMAPENIQMFLQASRSPARHQSEITEESDIFSLGVMLFEFLTGRRPFGSPKSTTPTDLEAALLARGTKIRWNDEDKVSDGMRAIVDHCLQFDENARYRNCQELFHDLKLQEQGLPLRFARERMVSRVAKRVRRHPNLTWGALCLAIGVFILAPLTITTIESNKKNARLTTQGLLNAFVTDSDNYLADSMADPDRARDKSIRIGAEIIKKHGLDKTGGSHLVLPNDSDEQRKSVREAAKRHVGQVAFFELSRLRAMGPDFVPDELSRFDELLATLELIDDESRAVAFLRASRAGLVNDPNAEQIRRAAQQVSNDSDTEKYLDAVRLISAKRYHLARPLLTALADRESIPKRAQWASLGRVQLIEGKFESAKLLFTQAIERSPESSKLHVLRGICFRHLENPHRAMDDFTRAIELDPGNKQAWANRGLGHLVAKRHREAIDDFSSMLHLDPSNVHALLKRAEAYEANQQPVKAEADFHQAMSIHTTDPRDLVSRGRAKREKSDFVGAIEEFQVANRYDSNNAMILNAIANTYTVGMSNHSKALDFYNQAIDVSPSNETILIDRAIVSARLSLYDQAWKDLNLATADGNLPRTLYQAACVCALLPDKQKHHVRGLKFLAQAIRAGYKAEELTTDADLDSLREFPGFQAIIRTCYLSELKRK